MISTYEFLATWLRARFADTERGASLVEYALLVALIAVICIVALQFLGNEASESFNSTGERHRRRQLSRAHELSKRGGPSGPPLFASGLPVADRCWLSSGPAEPPRSAPRRQSEHPVVVEVQRPPGLVDRASTWAVGDALSHHDQVDVEVVEVAPAWAAAVCTQRQVGVGDLVREHVEAIVVEDRSLRAVDVARRRFPTKSGRPVGPRGCRCPAPRGRRAPPPGSGRRFEVGLVEPDAA